MDLEETELIAAMLARISDEFLKTYSPRRGFLNFHEAEDVASTVVSELFAKAESLQPKLLEGLFRSVFARRAIDQLRRKKRQAFVHMGDSLPVSIETQKQNDLEYKELVSILKRKAESLADRERVYVEDHLFHQKSPSVIAKSHGVKIQTVSSALTRAKEKLQLAIREVYGNDI